jgi:hypothetical protein
MLLECCCCVNAAAACMMLLLESGGALMVWWQPVAAGGAHTGHTLCRYNFLHKKRMLLPDDSFRERSNGEGGHMKLWAVVERVEADLDAAEEQYKDEMTEEQSQFAENLNFISNHVKRVSGYTDMSKVCACLALLVPDVCHAPGALVTAVALHADGAVQRGAGGASSEDQGSTGICSAIQYARDDLGNAGDGLQSAQRGHGLF